LLASAGADLEVRAFISDCTPLHFAAFVGHEESIKTLLYHGANRNAMAKGRMAGVEGKSPYEMYVDTMQDAFGHDPDFGTRLVEDKLVRCVA
jgi:ankyrin repeat protein